MLCHSTKHISIIASHNFYETQINYGLCCDMVNNEIKINAE